MVGVIAGLGRQVEGDRQASLPLAEVGAIQFVGGPGRGMAGVGPHQPGFITFDLGGHGSLFMCDSGSGFGLVFFLIPTAKVKQQPTSFHSE